VWNYNGWLHVLGALDFAGGTVVHISSATAGLTAAIILGKRHDWQHGTTSKPPNVPFIVLGASLLW
jgi:Amt family ammonium transporter